MYCTVHAYIRTAHVLYSLERQMFFYRLALVMEIETLTETILHAQREGTPQGSSLALEAVMKPAQQNVR